MLTSYSAFHEAAKAPAAMPERELARKAAELANFAKRHDTDYGTVFVKPGTNDLFVVNGDGAGYDAPDDRVNGERYDETLKRMAKEMGFNEPELADEYFPNPREGWRRANRDGSLDRPE